MPKEKYKIPSISNYNLPENTIERGVNSQYNTSTRAGESINDALAREQGTLDAAGNILGRFGGRALLSLGEMAALPYSITKAVSDRSLASLFDNDVTAALENVNKALTENTPFYDTDKESQAKFFSDPGTVLGSAGFWGNFLGEGGGFLAGAALGGMGTGAALKLGGKLLSKGLTAAKMARGLSVASQDANKIKSLIDASKAGTLPEKINSILKGNSIKSAIQFKTQETLANMYEAGVEARGIKEEFINNKVEELKQLYGDNYKPTDIQLKEFEDEANTYANVGFIANMGLLMIDGVGMSKLFQGYSNTRRAINALEKEGKYISRTGWKKGVENLYNYTKGSLKELGQEGGQFFVEKTLTDKKLDEKKASENSIVDYYKAMTEAASETFGSKEGQESMLIGFLLGAPNSAIEGVKQTQWNKKGIELLNKNLTRDALLPILRNTNNTILNNKGDDSTKMAESASQYAFQASKDEEFYNWVDSKIKTDRFDDAINNLENLKNMPVEEFNQAHGTSFTEVKKQETINSLIDSATKINKLHDSVNEQYANHPNKEEIIQTLADGLLLNKRIKSLQSKLANPDIENNSLEAELLATDLGFLQQDKLDTNKRLLDLVAGKQVTPKRKPQEVKVNTPEGVKEGVKVIETKTEEDTKVTVDTPDGRIVTDEADILKEGESFTGDHKPLNAEDNEDEDKEEYVKDNEDKPKKSFTEDIENDNPKSFMDWTDFQLNSNANFDTSNKSGEEKEVAEANKKVAQQIHDAIIDSGLSSKENYNFITEEEGDNTNVYAIPIKGGNKIKLGYFNNLDTSKASEIGKKDKRTMSQFLGDYSQTPQGAKKPWDIVKSLTDALGRLKIKSQDITSFLSLRSKIANGRKPTSLETIMNSPYANRWKINNEFLIAYNRNGEYTVDSKFVQNLDNADLIVSELDKLKEKGNLNSLGTQYIILTKRPDSEAYQFIGLKGRDLAPEETQAIIDEINNLKNDPNVTPDNIGTYVKSLNDRVFLATNERFVNQNGEEVPIHIEFYNKKGTKDIVIWATRKIVGTTKDTTQQFGYNKTFRSGKAMEDIIRSASRAKINRSDDTTIEDLSKDLVSNAQPQLWNTFFRFNHKAYLETGVDVPATQEVVVESEKPKVVQPLDKKSNIEKRRQEANNKNEKFWEQFTAINAEEVADRDNLINKFIKDIQLPTNTRINNWVLEELNGKLWEGKNIRGKEEEFFGKENWDKIKEAKKQFDIEFKKIEDSNLAKIKLIEQKQSNLLNTIDGLELRKAWSFGLIEEPNVVGLDETNFISKETEFKNGDLVETDNYEGYYYLSKANKDGEWYEQIIGKTEQEVKDKINAKYDAELTALGNTEKPKVDLSIDTTPKSVTIGDVTLTQVKNKYGATENTITNDKTGEGVFQLITKEGKVIYSPIIGKNFIESISKYSGKNISEQTDLIFSGIPLKELFQALDNKQLETPKEEPKSSFEDWKPEDNSNTNEDIVFSRNDDEDVFIEHELVVKNIAALIGFKVEFRKYADNTIKGEFRDDLIILNEAGFPLGTEYHEAFHAIFSILPKNEQRRVLDLVYKTYGITNAEFQKVVKDYKDNLSPELFAKVMTRDKIISIVLEEKLAELFRNYMNDRPPVILKDFFSRFKLLIKKLLGLTQEEPFKVLFERITSGEFKDISAGGKTLGRYMRIPKTNKQQSQELIDEIGNYYLNKTKKSFLDNMEVYKDSPGDLKGFVHFYLKNKQEIERNKIKATFDKLDDNLRNGAITPKVHAERLESLKRQLFNYHPDKYPKYLEITPELVDILSKEITKKYDLSKIKTDSLKTKEGEDPEESDTMYNTPEMESNPRDGSSSQMVIKYFKQMYVIEDSKVSPIGLVESESLYNNLLFRLSSVDKKNYKTFLEENSTSGTTRYNKIMEKILDLYNNDDLFARNFDTAFDRSFATFYENYFDLKQKGDKLETTNAVGVKNVNNYTDTQLKIWSNEYYNKRIEISNDINKALSITLEPNTYSDPDGKTLINDLLIATRSNKDKLVSEFVKDAKVLEKLKALAKVNVKYRLDLNDLTARNTKDKVMYSMMNNSWIIEKLKTYGKNWGVYVGSRFNNNKLDYGDLDPRSMFLTTFGMWNNYTDKKEHIPHYFVQQIEAKSTNYIFKGESYFNKPFEDIKSILTNDITRQQVTYNNAKDSLNNKDGEDLVEGYHIFNRKKDKDGNIIESYAEAKNRTLEALTLFESGETVRSTLPRAFLIHNIPYANDYKNSKEEVNQIVTEENWNKYLNKMYNNILLEMEASQLPLETLAKMYSLSDPKTTLKAFLVDQYLNRMQVVAHITPDLGQFKDYVDITKRGGGLAASGPNHGEGVMPFGMSEDIEFDTPLGKINSTDAAGAETINERINRLIKLGKLAKYDNPTDEINSQMFLDYKLLEAYRMDDREYIRKYGDNDPNALLKVEKTVGYNDDYYIKSSVTVLTRFATSDEVPDEITITRVVNGETKTYTAFQDTNNGKYYLPRVGSELSWMNMNKMQKQKLSAIFAKSAIKKNVHSLTNSQSEDDYKVHLFNYADYRLQQENPSGKLEVKDGSQMIELIDAYFENSNTLKNKMENLISKIKQHNYDIYGPEVRLAINNDIFDPFIEHIKNATEGSALTDRLTEFFEVEKGSFKNSVSLPIIKLKFEQYMMSYFSNKVALHKTAGNKCTLITSQFKGIAEIDGETLSSYEMDLMRTGGKVNKEGKRSKLYNPDKANTATSRELRWIPENGGYAEAIVTEEYIQQFGLNIAQFWNIKPKYDTNGKLIGGNPKLWETISRALVYRIPTQAQHSMLPIRIVDVLPSSYGSSIILPKEITIISGADYDVDSVFIHKPEIFKDGKLRTFKNKDSQGNPDNASRQASWENNSIISDYLELKEEELVTPIKAELKSLQQQLKGLAKEDADEETVENLKDNIALLKLDINNAKNRSLNETLDNLYKQTGNNYYNRNSVEFELPEVMKNDLLEERLSLLSSPEGAKLINNPASDFFKDIYEETFEKVGFPNPKKEAAKYLTYSGQDNMSNEYRKVSTGSKAIGGAAIMNKVFAFAQKNNIDLTSDNIDYLQKLFPLNYNISDRFEDDINLDVVDGEIVITDTNKKLKSDTLSNNVSITVDNAKDQTLIKFHLNDKNISEASVLAGLGFGINRLSLFLQQPISKKLSSILSISDNEVYEGSDFQDNGKKILSYLKKFSDKGISIVTLNDEALLSAVKNYKSFQEVETLLDKNTLTAEDKQKLSIQYTIGILYAELSNIAKDAYTINTILNYNKTIGSSVDDLFKITGAIETINSTKEFSFEKHNIRNNKFVQVVNSSTNNIEKRVRKLMIAYSGNITNFVNVFMSASKHFTTKKQTNEEDFISVGKDATDKKFQGKLTNKMLEYLSIQLLRTSLMNLPESIRFDIKDKDIISGKRVIEAYNNALNYLPAYEIGLLMQETKKNSKSPYPFARITVESFSKPTPEIEEAIMNSFEDMLISSNPAVKTFALELLRHVAAHDNYEYVSSSIVSKLRSKRFTTLNEVYKTLENKILSGENIFDYVAAITGNNKEYIKQNFIRYFTLDKRIRKEFLEINDNSVTKKIGEKEYVPLQSTKTSTGWQYTYGPNDKVYSPIVIRVGDDLYARIKSETPNGVQVLSYNLIETPSKSYKVIPRQLSYNEWLALLNDLELIDKEEYVEYKGNEAEKLEEKNPRIIDRINSFNTIEELLTAWNSEKFDDEQRALYKEDFTKRRLELEDNTSTQTSEITFAEDPNLDSQADDLLNDNLESKVKKEIEEINKTRDLVLKDISEGRKEEFNKMYDLQIEKVKDKLIPLTSAEIIRRAIRDIEKGNIGFRTLIQLSNTKVENISGDTIEELTQKIKNYVEYKVNSNNTNNIEGREFTFFVGEDEKGDKYKHILLINNVSLTKDGDYHIIATNKTNGNNYDMITDPNGSVISYTRNGKTFKDVADDQIDFGPNDSVEPILPKFSIVRNNELSLPDELIEIQNKNPNITLEIWNNMDEETKESLKKCYIK